MLFVKVKILKNIITKTWVSKDLMRATPENLSIPLDKLPQDIPSTSQAKEDFGSSPVFL